MTMTTTSIMKMTSLKMILMFDAIKKFLKGSEDKLDNITNDVALAAGVILLEVAYSDKEFAEEERSFIVNILKQDFNLSDDETHELIEIGTMILKEDTNKWRYINLINEKYSNEEKLRLIHMIWKLIYIDDKLDKYEDHLAHKLSSLLHIPHHQLIQAKLKVLHK